MADQHQVQRVREGMDVWNTWRVAHPDQTVDLDQANLEQLHLEGLLLDGAHLVEARLWDATLKNSSLRHATLDGADLRSVMFEAVDLYEASIQQADLFEALFQSVNADKASFSYARLDATHLWQSSMQATNFAYARLRDAFVREVDFRGANLQYADVKHTRFTRCDLTGADLRFAILHHATLQEVKLNGCRIEGMVGAHIRLEQVEQHDLVVREAPLVLVDGLALAQWIAHWLDHPELHSLLLGAHTRLVLLVAAVTLDTRATLAPLRAALRSAGFEPLVIGGDRALNGHHRLVVELLLPLCSSVLVDPLFGTCFRERMHDPEEPRGWVLQPPGERTELPGVQAILNRFGWLGFSAAGA